LKTAKTIALWLIVALLLIALFNLFEGSSYRSVRAEVAYSEFLAKVDNGRVSNVYIQGHRIRGVFDDGSRFTTFAPDDPDLVRRLHEKGIDFAAEPEEDALHPLIAILVSWLPMLIFIGILVYQMRLHRLGARANQEEISSRLDRLAAALERDAGALGSSHSRATTPSDGPGPA
jgi:cell division protease FtsH